METIHNYLRSTSVEEDSIFEQMSASNLNLNGSQISLEQKPLLPPSNAQQWIEQQQAHSYDMESQYAHWSNLEPTIHYAGQENNSNALNHSATDPQQHLFSSNGIPTIVHNHSVPNLQVLTNSLEQISPVADNTSSDDTTVASSCSPAESQANQPLLPQASHPNVHMHQIKHEQMHGQPVHNEQHQQPHHPLMLNTQNMDGAMSDRPNSSLTDQSLSNTPSSRKRAKSVNLLTPGSSIAERQVSFSAYRQDTWHKLLDASGREMRPMGLQVQVERGITYSAIEQAFVNQKRNHFHLVMVVACSNAVKAEYVLSRIEGQAQPQAQPISEFQLVISGVRLEMPSSLIKIRQSNPTNRKQFDTQPIRFLQQREHFKVSDTETIRPPLPHGQITRIRLARLHFAEATRNNNRVNQRQNPDQKYFALTVSLDAITTDGRRKTVCAVASEKLIVRASNPGQFEQEESAVGWQKAAGDNSALYYPGPVCIGTTNPQGTLTVAGDISVTGHVFKPSDRKLKESIQDYDCANALSRLERMRIVSYKIREEIADQWRLTEHQRYRVGVIAQELQQILPDAVCDDVNNDYLQVDENRLFYEFASAVQELCRLIENMGGKIEEVEKISSKTENAVSKLKRLAVLKRYPASLFSDKSETSSKAGGHHDNKSIGNFSGLSSRRSSFRFDSMEHRLNKPADHDGGYCHYHCESRPSFSPRANRTIIFALIASLAFCLISMGVLVTFYVIEWHNRNQLTTPTYQIIHSHNCNSSDHHDLVTWLPPQPPQLISVEPSNQRRWDLIRNWSQPVWTGENESPAVLHACDDQDECHSFCHCSSAQIVSLPPNDKEQRLTTSMGNAEGMDLATDIIWQPPRQQMALRYRVVTENEDYDWMSGIDYDDDETRGKNKWTSTDFRIELPDFNVTIDETYCWEDSCDATVGDYRLFVPISESMPLMPVAVKFHTEDHRTVDYCRSQVADECPVSDKNSKLLKQPSNLAVKVCARFIIQNRLIKIRDNLYDLPVGMFTRSRHQFRVGFASDLCGSENLSDIGKTFEQFTLIFYRACDQ